MNPIEVSSEDFRRLAERITDLAAKYLENLDEQRISPETRGQETLNLFGGALPEQGMGEEALASLPDIIRLSRAQNGRFFGYVLGSGRAGRCCGRSAGQCSQSKCHRMALRPGGGRHRADGCELAGAGDRLPRFSRTSHGRWLIR